MKKLICSMMMAAACAAMADVKIGTVDMLTLVRNHKSYETNKKFLTDSEKESQDKIEGMRGEVEKLETEGRKLAEEAQNPMLAAGKRQELEKKLIEIQKKYVGAQQAIRSEAMRAQQDLQGMEAKFLKITGDDLRKVIREFAEKNGYDLIVDVTAAPYSKKSLDVTDGVLTAMGGDPRTAKRADKEEAKK